MVSEILIVDDSCSSQITLKMALKRHDFECDICGSIKCALSMLKLNSYLFVICDVSMDGANGTKMASLIKAKYPATKLFFISAFLTEDQLTTSFDTFFEKPVDIDNLAELLEKMTRNAKKRFA